MADDHQEARIRRWMREAHRGEEHPPAFHRLWRAEVAQRSRRGWSLAAILTLTLGVAALLLFDSGPWRRSVLGADEALELAESLRLRPGALDFLDRPPGTAFLDSLPDLYRSPTSLGATLPSAPEADKETP